MSKEIDDLEAPLREAHKESSLYFSDFVNYIRYERTHPLHETAVKFNRAVYEMQNRR